MECRICTRLAGRSEIDLFLIFRDSAPTAEALALALANVQLFAGDPDRGRNGMFSCRATVPLSLLLAVSGTAASEQGRWKSRRAPSDPSQT